MATTKHERTITFTVVIFTNAQTGRCTGIVKELDGVIVSGESKEEVVAKMPRAINRMWNHLRTRKGEDFVIPNAISETQSLEYALG